MINSIGKITLAGLLAATVLGMPVKVSAQTEPATPAAPTQPAKPKATRFGGKLGEVDKAAKTIVVENLEKGKRTFQITSKTRIMRNGKPATLEDAVPGDMVHGMYSTTEDGKLAVHAVSFGKPTPPPAPGAPNAVPAAPPAPSTPK